MIGGKDGFETIRVRSLGVIFVRAKKVKMAASQPRKAFISAPVRSMCMHSVLPFSIDVN